MKPSRFPRHPTPHPPDLLVPRLDSLKRRFRKTEEGNHCSLPTSHRTSDTSPTKPNIPPYPRHFTSKTTDLRPSCARRSSSRSRSRSRSRPSRTSSSSTAIAIAVKTRTRRQSLDFSHTSPSPQIDFIPTISQTLEARLCLGTPIILPHQTRISSRQVSENKIKNIYIHPRWPHLSTLHFNRKSLARG